MDVEWLALNCNQPRGREKITRVDSIVAELPRAESRNDVAIASPSSVFRVALREKLEINICVSSSGWQSSE